MGVSDPEQPARTHEFDQPSKDLSLEVHFACHPTYCWSQNSLNPADCVLENVFHHEKKKSSFVLSSFIVDSELCAVDCPSALPS